MPPDPNEPTGQTGLTVEIARAHFAAAPALYGRDFGGFFSLARLYHLPGERWQPTAPPDLGQHQA